MFCHLWFSCIMLIGLLQVSTGVAQTQSYTAFTVNEGLPSNNIYSITEDHKGFLWVCTDAGIARFDGKNFQTYTVQQGLPDNQVYVVEKEKNGRLWVICYNRILAYFDEVQNRFISPLDEKTQEDFSSYNITFMFPLAQGGILYLSQHSLVFKDARVRNYSPSVQRRLGLIINEWPDGCIALAGGNAQGKFWLYRIKGNKTDSVLIHDGTGSENNLWPVVNNGKLYGFMRYSDLYYVFSQIRIDALSYQKDTIRTPERYLNFNVSDNTICFLGFSGKIYVYDKQSLELKYIVYGDYQPNTLYEDSKGNKWVGTMGKGLLLYRNNALQKPALPEQYSRINFSSIACKQDGTLLAGSYQGEIVEITKGGIITHKIFRQRPLAVNKIMVMGKDVYSFSDYGNYLNFAIPLVEPEVTATLGKTAIGYNDSIILVGTHYGLLKLNTQTNKIKRLPPWKKNPKRITALVKGSNDTVYFGSTDGLYQYVYRDSNYTSLGNVHPVLKRRIAALYYTTDGLLWVSSLDNTLLALVNDTILATIPVTTGAVKNIIAAKPGQLWIATSNGIRVIQYLLQAGSLVYTTQTLSAVDGLASNDVHELFYQNDTIFAATGNGISMIPANYTVPQTNMPVYLTGMSINQRDTVIAESYQLKYGQQNINMRFAGVDLSGHFGFLQYQLDGSDGWIKLAGNTLNIQLQPGDHVLNVSAVDVNGNQSNKVLVIRFDITVPFWRNIGFLLTAGIVAQIGLYYFISRHLKRKKEVRLARKMANVQAAAIEQQAFTSLMNPHFIFNALNSIQHYINIQDRKNANRYLSDFASLIRKNFDAVQQSFIPLDEEAENIKIYLDLEQMRFEHRFRYSIRTDDDVDAAEWMIPTMMLQPLLENALLHGLMPSAIPGEISIVFKREHQDLLIIIIDNGIGTANSLALKGSNTHKSHGMELIRKRIKALSGFGAKPMSISVAPAFDSITNPGTKVTLLIPAMLYKEWLHTRRH